MTATTPRPRKDVVRNRQRILDAAQELFAQQGLGVTLHDIARHAGVGVGTMYRHFPDKAELIDLLFEEQLEHMAQIAHHALTEPDPWQAVIDYHEQTLTLQARDRGLKELILGMPDAPERAARLRQKLHPLATQIIQRAQTAGVVRPDCETQDFGVAILIMVGAVIDAARDIAPDLWRRYLNIALQGLRPPTPPLPLDVPAVAPEQMETLLVSAWNHQR